MKKLFYVTGLPRSGTSWTALALTTALNALHIYEPYNWEFYPESRPFSLRYVPTGARDRALLAVLGRELANWRRPRHTLKVMRAPAVVVKDVHSMLALSAIWRRFRPNTIIVVRHPCAVAASWQRVDFAVSHRIDTLLSQPRLLADHLAPFADHLRARADYFYQLGALWGAIYWVLKRQASAHPHWRWITHEALCADPQTAFADLLAAFGRQQTAAGRKFLASNNRQPDPTDGPFSVVRLSAAQPSKWRSQLTDAEAAAVVAGCQPFGLLETIYGDSDV